MRLLLLHTFSTDFYVKPVSCSCQNHVVHLGAQREKYEDILCRILYNRQMLKISVKISVKKRMTKLQYKHL